MTAMEIGLMVTVAVLLVVCTVLYRKFNEACNRATQQCNLVKHHIDRYKKLTILRNKLSARLAKAEELLRRVPKSHKKRYKKKIQAVNQHRPSVRREKDAIRNEIRKYI